MKTTEDPVVVEHFFPIEPVILWSAITELDQMLKWYFDNIPSFKAEVGFETSFEVQSDERVFIHHWKVVEVIPLKKIKYNWHYMPKYEGDSNVTFSLSHKNNGTLLRLETEVIEDFPDDIPEFKIESCRAGWNYFIKERLNDYIRENYS